LKAETDLSKEQIRNLYKQQYGLLIYYLDEYLAGDEFNNVLQEETGYSLDDVAGMATQQAVNSGPPQPGTLELSIPNAIKTLMTKDELAKLAAAA
jgi:hypothetical protein